MKLSKDSLKVAVKNNRNILINILGAFLVKGGSMLLTLFLQNGVKRAFDRPWVETLGAVSYDDFVKLVESK